MTNKTYSELFAGGGVGGSGGWTRPILISTSITIPFALTAYIRAMGAGGGGAVGAANSAAATGGNSAPWGYKKVELAGGQVLAITIGATGAKAAALNTNGSQGGSTIINVDGSPIMTCQGGEGGRRTNTVSTVITAPTPAATVTGADYWTPGIQAGDASFASGNTVSTGGAAVDLLSLGVGRSANSTSPATSPGGAVGADAASGGRMPYPWLGVADWGFVFADPSLGSATVGIPGSGGAAVTRIAGPFGGGASQGTGTDATSNAGFGAGGGGGQSVASAGNGGQGYAFIVFVPKF